MKLEFSANIYASDPESRTLTGQIVPFNKSGFTSAGEVVFLEGSFVELDPSKVKLLLEHEQTSPIGKAVSFEIGAEGIIGKFKLSDTSKARDVIVEAQDGLRTGFSVGANVLDYTFEGNVMKVAAAELLEVSVVANAAFGEDAQIREIAASQSAEVVSTETKEETVEQETTVQVEEAAAPAVVEAAAPVYAAAVRKPDANELTLAVVNAARGDAKAQQVINAALDGATTSTSYGVIPVSYMTDVIDIINSERSFINSISRGALPAAGLEFKKPRWSSYPTVGAHSAEYAEIATNDALIENITVEVVARMGGNRVSLELLDRSAPEYMAQLRQKLAEAYAIHTDSAALTTFLSHTYTAAGTGYAALVDAIKSVRVGTKKVANRLLVSPDEWANLVTMTDEVGRPLFSPIAPSNAAGIVDGFAGSILGLQVVVSDNAPEGTAVVYTDRAATYYEAAGSPASLEAMKVSTAEVEIAVKGYDAFCEDYLFEISAGTFRNAGAYAVALTA